MGGSMGGNEGSAAPPVPFTSNGLHWNKRSVLFVRQR